MDQFLYADSFQDQKVEPKVSQRQVIYALDQNAGSYSSQILFDLTSLANSGKWLAFSEATLEIPYVVSMKSSVDISSVANAFSMGLKNGYYQIIDSCQVDYNGSTVVQQQRFNNIITNFKLLVKSSVDDVQKWGPSVGFVPDSSGSYTYSTAAATGGDGYSNNRNGPDSTNFAAPDAYNAGFRVRQLQTTGWGKQANSSTIGYGSLPTINSVAGAVGIAKNYFAADTGSGANAIYSYVIVLQIRLKDICDFFDKLPLIRGGGIRLIINYNAFTVSVTTTLASTNASFVVAANGITVNSGSTCPMLLASGASTSANASLPAGTLTLSCGVNGNTLSSSQSKPFSSCRIYVPAYNLDPVAEQQYLTQVPKKEIIYDDYYQFQITSVANGANFNQLLTQGITMPKYIVVIPFAASAGLANNSAIPPWQSPFDTAPATTTPLAALSNFNIQLGGVNLFQQNEIYDFQQFQDELSRIFAINGGCTVGLANGLLSQYDFDNSYRFYVGDLTRIPVQDRAYSKSISIVGTNATNVNLTLLCFVMYEKRVWIQTDNGELTTE